MYGSVYFNQECPTCGRRLRIRVDFLGRVVACQHCKRSFQALDNTNANIRIIDEGSDLLKRADELLASGPSRRTHPR